MLHNVFFIVCLSFYFITVFYSSVVFYFNLVAYSAFPHISVNITVYAVVICQ